MRASGPIRCHTFDRVPDTSDDSLARPSFTTLPLDSLDKACLAATQAPWSSFAPTWKLDLRGDIDAGALEAALRSVAKRYPSLSATISGGRWRIPEAATVSLGEASSEASVLDRFLDVERDGLFEARLLRTGPDAATLLFHQHHALADGRAFLEFVGDFFTALRTSSSEHSLIARRPHVEVVQTNGLGRWLDAVRGAWVSLSELALALLRPVDALRCNQGTDFESGHRTLHLDVPMARLEAWKAGRDRHGLSTNDLLSGALLRALTPWSAKPNGRHTLFLPVDARPRTGFRSFANHLTSLQLRWTANASTSALEFARHVHREAARQTRARLPWIRVPFDAFVGRVTPLSAMRKAVHVERRLLTNFSFSNLLPLGTPGAPWATERLRVERLRITTPCLPPQAVNLTVARSGDAACFNFNFKPSAMPEAEVAQLVQRYQAALDELDRELST